MRRERGERAKKRDRDASWVKDREERRGERELSENDFYILVCSLSLSPYSFCLCSYGYCMEDAKTRGEGMESERREGKEIRSRI